MGRGRFVLALAAGLALAGVARADVTYNFRFLNYQQVDAEGTFSTGAASTQDAGYFLVTGLKFTGLRDATTGNFDTGNLTATGLQPGAAYNPTTQAFINHFAGNTYRDIGLFFLSGSAGPDGLGGSSVQGRSFAQGTSPNLVTVYDVNGDVVINAYDGLEIIPEKSTSIPNPSSIVLLATGLLGLFGFGRGRRMARRQFRSS
jgi:hypothetical protein